MPILKPTKKRSGPETICPNGEIQKRTNISISDTYKALAKEIGDENISAGIRVSLDYYRANHK